MLQVLGGLGCKNLDWVCLNIRAFLEIWLPGFSTRTTYNNFGYRDLLLEIVFGFSGFEFFRFGLGFFEFEFRVSDNSHSHEIPLGLNPVDLAVSPGPGTRPDSVHTMRSRGRGPRREEIGEEIARTRARAQLTGDERAARARWRTTSSHLHVPATAIHGRARVERVRSCVGRPGIFFNVDNWLTCVLDMQHTYVGCWLRINVVHADHFVVAGEMHEQ